MHIVITCSNKHHLYMQLLAQKHIFCLITCFAIMQVMVVLTMFSVFKINKMLLVICLVLKPKVNFGLVITDFPLDFISTNLSLSQTYGWWSIHAPWQREALTLQLFANGRCESGQLLWAKMVFPVSGNT